MKSCVAERPATEGSRHKFRAIKRPCNKTAVQKGTAHKKSRRRKQQLFVCMMVGLRQVLPVLPVVLSGPVLQQR